MAAAMTLFDKIWSQHVVFERDDGETLLYIDRLLLNEGCKRSFEILQERDLKVVHRDSIVGSPDHYAPTTSRSPADISEPERRVILETMMRNARDQDFTFFGLDDPRAGIVHVIGPEQGVTQPGVTMICGDSHTTTHGGLAALAFGIGHTETAHVLATQTLWQQKPKTMRIAIDGKLRPGVVAKDLILAIIAKISAAGATGHAVEFAGSTIRGLSVEGRLTVCNMATEAGAKCGMIAPDDVTYAYLEGRPFAPQGPQWEKAVAFWRGLPSDTDAVFDREVKLDAAEIPPMVTWGTSPEDAVPVTGSVPNPADIKDDDRRSAMTRSLEYMGLKPGTPLTSLAFDQVFIGSCTNARIEDLRAASQVIANRRAVIPAMVVPGSMAVKRQAEEEGLDRIFKEAGFEWREAGCSMCLGMNGDVVPSGQRCASTSNRNFVGRQGPGSRTHLMSPAMAAAVAVNGKLVDVSRPAQGG